MTKNKTTLILVSALLLFLCSFSFGSISRLSMRMETQTLHNGKLVKIEADIFYQTMNGRMLTRYLNPYGKIMISNDKGELSIFDEKDNTVEYLQSDEFSTDTHLLYFFLQGKIQDMGLSELGFQQMEVRFEDGVMVSEWFPPQSLYGLFNRVELVHENYLPIYMSYYDAQRNKVKEVYFSDYEFYSDISLPGRITEFNYLNNDSIIRRMFFNDIQVNFSAQSPWFNFEIPSDARIMSQ